MKYLSLILFISIFLSPNYGKTVFHWIIVQDDNNWISLYESNYFVNISREFMFGQFVVNEMYSYISLRVFPVFVTLWKKYTTTVGTSKHD